MVSFKSYFTTFTNINRFQLDELLHCHISILIFSKYVFVLCCIKNVN